VCLLRRLQREGRRFPPRCNRGLPDTYEYHVQGLLSLPFASTRRWFTAVVSWKLALHFSQKQIAHASPFWMQANSLLMANPVTSVADRSNSSRKCLRNVLSLILPLMQRRMRSWLMRPPPCSSRWRGPGPLAGTEAYPWVRH